MTVKDLVSSHYVSVDANDTVSQLLGKLKVLDELAALVFSGKELEGMADKRKFLKSRFDAKTMKVKKVLTKVPILSSQDDDNEAARLMQASDMHSLPVVEGSEVLGVVHAREVLRLLKPELSRFRLSDLATSELFTLDEDEWISKAINRFREKGFDHVPVVDKKGNLIGIVATTDLLEKYYAHPPKRQGGFALRGAASKPNKEFDFAHLPIQNEMSLLVHTLKPSDPVSKAIDTMISEHMSSLVIVEDKTPVGIVTISDLLGAISKIREAAVPSPERGRRR